LRVMTVDYPKKIQVETYLGCNARCPICTISQWTRKRGPMAGELFTKIVEQAAQFKDRLRVFSLYMDGEPLMDRLIEERVAQSKAAGLRNVGFSTNGSLLGEERSRRLLEAGLDWLAFSFDSIDKDTYESIRVGLKFDVVINNILHHVELRNQMDSPSKVIIRFIEQEGNRGQFESFRDYWSDRLSGHLDEIQVYSAHNWGHGDQEQKDYGNTPCDYVFDNCVILRDGTIPLCCVDFNAEYVFGNLTKTPLLDIWNSPQWRRVRELHAAGNRSELELCSTCDIPELTKKLED
jgi:radical SAM protein with 4Fe4S-binding SPASM domain